ncbi:hypothetical protein F751_6893 [Auxenochlorella protothecoides]|uniref:Uncharacterized protein n=1 Tax=Auxenochlorella protothecoides TaxID=3075 RepID=A0A087SDX1_AUXPR|nr:hypothetical protein F751_6893 [Auxenochlorella protothecoides]KFM23925.1 hypothetical protein F751_6893 [Auxenochlorella protothecoides]
MWLPPPLRQTRRYSDASSHPVTLFPLPLHCLLHPAPTRAHQSAGSDTRESLDSRCISPRSGFGAAARFTGAPCDLPPQL